MTLPSCSKATAAHAGAVIVSGSYGGKYNAFNAAKWGHPWRHHERCRCWRRQRRDCRPSVPRPDRPCRRHCLAPPPITEGTRVILREVPGEPRLICAGSVGMLRPEDAGQIVAAASHAALPGGRPDTIIPRGIYAVFFSDAGVGLDAAAGIARLRVLDADGIIAGTASAASASIGDSRALYERGVLSHLTKDGVRAGGAVGMPLKELLLAAARP